MKKYAGDLGNSALCQQTNKGELFIYSEKGVCCGSNDEITVLGHYSYRQTTGKRVICGFGQNSQHSGLDSKKMQINAYNCIY